MSISPGLAHRHDEARNSARSNYEIPIKHAKEQAKPFSISFRVKGSPRQVFDAINDVGSWWTGKVKGTTDRVGGQFEYRYQDIHRSTQKITALLPGKKVAWEVVDSQLPSFGDGSEWTGTRMEFEIAASGSGTEVRFTHHGLLPSCDCFAKCAQGWTHLMTDCLKSRIIAGRGEEKRA